MLHKKIDMRVICICPLYNLHPSNSVECLSLCLSKDIRVGDSEANNVTKFRLDFSLECPSLRIHIWNVYKQSVQFEPLHITFSNFYGNLPLS